MKKSHFLEANIDTLAGPTHHFGGHSFGNVASMLHQSKPSFPKKAALQGLEKMYRLHQMGLTQIVFPPQPRPCIEALMRLGFSGSSHEILQRAWQKSKQSLLQAASSSFMWTANCATITPSCDSQDQKIHFTVANLASNFHRSCETDFTSKLFHKVFHDNSIFTHHCPAPSAFEYFDEGAANHIRFCDDEQNKGLHLFVYGRNLQDKAQTQKYPARQTLEAQQAIARSHKLLDNHVVFAKQNPAVIDKGVFHNDVISTGHKLFYLVHEHAFEDTSQVIRDLENKAYTIFKKPLITRVVTENELSVQDAVSTYLFNSQIISINGSMVLIAPEEAKDNRSSRSIIQSLIDDSNIDIEKVEYMTLNESMMNGGGPACLRIRLVITEHQLQRMHQGVILSEKVYGKLAQCIEELYPDTFTIDQLTDKSFVSDCFHACKEVARLLSLQELYPESL